MRYAFLLITVLLLLPFVTAASTDITLKTLPAYTVFLTVVKPTDTYEPLITPQKLIAGYNGEVHYTFVDETNLKFKVLAVVKWQGEQKFREEFGPYSAGEPIRVELLPEGYVDPLGGQEEVENESAVAEESENVTQLSAEETIESNITEDTISQSENNDTAASITGEAVSTSEKSTKIFNEYGRYILYGAGILIVVFAVIFSIVAVTKRRKDKFVISGMQPTSLFPPKREKSNTPEMDRIENEIQQVEAEIERVKKMDRIGEAQRRLEDKRRELTDLKRRHLGYV